MVQKERADALEWLDFVYQHLGDIGPGSCDFKHWLINKFEKENGKKIPEEYDYREEEDEDYI